MSYPVRIEFDVPAAMRDGTVLRANVLRPDGEGRFPVALTRTPYGKDFDTANSNLDTVRLARAGYIVVIQDVRGRFNSGGEWYPMRNEAQDGYDSVEWAAHLPKSNGRVGMFGGSYCGFTQWAAARMSPPHLHAIVPAMTWADARNGVITRGGAIELGLTVYWLLAGLSFDTILRRLREVGPMEQFGTILSLVNEIDRLHESGYRSLPLETFAPLSAFDVGSYFFDLLAQLEDPSAAAPFSIASAYDRVEVPSLNVGGWYDLFLKGTLDNFAALRTRAGTHPARQSRLLIGPWSHAEEGTVIGEQDFGFAAQMQFINLQTDLTGLTERWFDYWLKGIENGMTREPPVKLFIMGENLWRDENEWPPQRARQQDWFLHEGGILSVEAPGGEPADHYAYDPENPVPTNGGAILGRYYQPGVRDQRSIESREDVLVYTSAPFGTDLEVTGPVVVKLWAASSAPDTDYVARLVDVHPDGYAQNLTDGIVRARYRDGLAPRPLEPNRAYEFTIDLWATANVFKTGHRIRVDITSSNFPRWDRNLNNGEPVASSSTACIARQTVLHDADHPSHIVLPVIRN